jgi:hypothetical protein
LKVEDTEMRGNETIRKNSTPIILGERKDVQHRKGVVQCPAELQISQTPMVDGNRGHTVGVLECEKQFFLG